MPTTNGRDPLGEAERIAHYLWVALLEQCEEGTIEIQRQCLGRSVVVRGVEVEDTYAEDCVPGILPSQSRERGAPAPAQLRRQAPAGSLGLAGT